jgi:hypothetical protein
LKDQLQVFSRCIFRKIALSSIPLNANQNTPGLYLQPGAIESFPQGRAGVILLSDYQKTFLKLLQPVLVYRQIAQVDQQLRGFIIGPGLSLPNQAIYPSLGGFFTPGQSK